MSANNHIIIVAGGTGSRMNNALPKQFIEINGKPVIIHTLEKFYSFDPEIKVYIAIHENYSELLNSLLKTFFFEKKIQNTVGGETRFHSVKNALALIEDPNGIVGIHDAARPMVSIQTIRNCFQTALLKSNAIPAIEINESIRKVNKNGNVSVNRKEFKIIQTPQCFKIDLLKNAFELPYLPEFTDDASVVEKAGHKINLVEGNPENMKITYAFDLRIAGLFLK